MFRATLFRVFLPILFLFPNVAPGQNLQQVIQGMQNRWARIRDASAVIEIQTWKKTEGDQVSVFYGQIYYLSPRLVRLEYSPAPQSATEPNLYPFGKNKYIYIHDSRELWRYSPSRDQWFTELGEDPVISMVNQIADINNFNVDRFLSIYQVANVQSDRLFGKIPTYILRAEPKRRGGRHPRQLLWIHSRTYLPVEAVLARDENEVSVFFHKIKENPDLPTDIFSTDGGGAG